MLIGRGDLQCGLPAEGDTARATTVRTFNKALLVHAVDTAEFGYLASAVTGGGVRVDRLTQLYLLAQLKGHPDPTEMIASLLKSATGLSTGQEAPATAEAARDLVSKQVKRVESDVLPMLRKAGVV
jgi:hypothetical protein